MTMVEKLKAHREIEKQNRRNVALWMGDRIRKKSFDRYEQEFIFDHGWRIAEDGKLELTQKQYSEYQYTGRSIKDSKIRTLTIPGIHGLCLIFEDKHFRIV